MHFLCDEVEPCPHVEAQFELKDKIQFFVCPYAIKEKQKVQFEKEMNQLEKLGYNYERP